MNSIESPKRGCIIGIDEVGRGPWAGNVVAAAVFWPENYALQGVKDSKKCSEKQRDALRLRLVQLPHGFGEATVAEIDQLNIREATFLAMQRAYQALCLQLPAAETTPVLVDGNAAPLGCTWQFVIGGDALLPAIAAASILAKTERDAAMYRLHQDYPQYGFDRHKGYGTAQHRAALAKFGVTPWHRQSFAPVRQMLLSSALHAPPATSECVRESK
jgi:ribonuclease HII